MNAQNDFLDNTVSDGFVIDGADMIKLFAFL